MALFIPGVADTTAVIKFPCFQTLAALVPAFRQSIQLSIAVVLFGLFLPILVPFRDPSIFHTDISQSVCNKIPLVAQFSFFVLMVNQAMD